MAGLLALAVGGCSASSAGGSRPAASGSASTLTSSSGSARPSDGATPTPTPTCAGQPAGARALNLSTSDGAAFAGLELGTGPKGVLLVPEAGRSGMCGWMSYATELAAKGLHVMLIGMPGSATGSGSADASAPGFGDTGVQAVVSALGRLRSDGATAVVAVGASAGASTALAAAESTADEVESGASAVVALSADELGDLPSKASTIHVPTLMAVADGDRYISADDERKLFDALATPAVIKTLDVLPASSGHGWDLLADQGFKDKVTTFITAQLATGYTVWGAGPRTVVLSNQSDESQAAWQAYADHLVAEGYRVAMWDYGIGDPAAALGDVVKALRAQQDGPIFLLGASKGAKVSLIAATSITPPVTAVVTLSAESGMASGVDVASYVKRLTCPALVLTAEKDGWGSADAAKTFQAVLPNLVRTLIYPGADHGTALLYGANGPKSIADIDAFLKAH
ncbi:MAG: alpha/beta hydrolase [Catenulispora sp.]|nr:alpha/beta hydrolase [Catenulispora sp.]